MSDVASYDVPRFFGASLERVAGRIAQFERNAEELLTQAGRLFARFDQTSAAATKETSRQILPVLSMLEDLWLRDRQEALREHVPPDWNAILKLLRDSRVLAPLSTLLGLRIE